MRALTCRLQRLDRIIWTSKNICSVRFDASDQEVEDLLNSQVDKGQTSPVGQVLTTRREALALYRDVLRISSLFIWPDQEGRIWSKGRKPLRRKDVIQKSARQEFEEARYEKDPEVVNRMLVVGRDALHRVAEDFAKKHVDLGRSDMTDK